MRRTHFSNITTEPDGGCIVAVALTKSDLLIAVNE
jgi:hypothetical protein